MSYQVDNTSDSNDYFFVGGISDGTFTAGKNSFTISPSAKVKESITTNNISVYDPQGNKLNVYPLIPVGSTEYAYTEDGKQVFGVIVYPNTTPGVGRIEIRAKALPTETVSASLLLNDKRFSPEVYGNGRVINPINTLWVKAIRFEPSRRNESPVRFFDFPQMVASAEVYKVRSRQNCGTSIATGMCNGTANSPKHGNAADYNYNIISANYVLSRLSGASFSSDMTGTSIRLTNISISALSFVTSKGERRTFTGTILGDFVAKIKQVLSDGSVLLDKPFTVSNAMLEGGSFEDTPYQETTGIDIKKYDSFNEVDLFSTTAKSSGVQKQQTNQVYNIGAFGVSHRKSYYTTNIESAVFEIIYLPREALTNVSFTYNATNPGEFSRYVCLSNIELSNLRTWTGAIDRYKVYKRSLNYPESKRLISEGSVEPSEVIFDWFAGEDTPYLGKFYSLEFAEKYWITRGNVSYIHTPKAMIDSITITSLAQENREEESYIILKNNRNESSPSNEYIQSIRTVGSFWTTSPKIYTNYGIEPTSSYNCVPSPINTIETTKSGPIYNSNFIKLIGNSVYEFSMKYSGLTKISTEYSFVIYFITTRNGISIKIPLGELNNKTTRGFSMGSYFTKFLVPSTMYGTILLVPKSISSITISDLSIKPFSDVGFSSDCINLRVPIDVSVKNEKIELSVELFDVTGKLVYGNNSNAFGTNVSLSPLTDVIIADPNWYTLEAFDKS